MNIYMLSSLAASFSAYIMGTFVFLKGKHKTVNKLYALVALLGGTWTLFPFLSGIAPDNHTALVFARFLYIFAVFCPPVFLQFTFALTGNHITARKRFYILFGYILSVALLFVVFHNIFFSDVLRFLPYFTLKPGILYPVFVVFLSTYHLYAWREIIIAYRNTGNNEKRNQLRYIFAAFVMVSIGALMHLLSPYFRAEPFPHDILIMVYFYIFAIAIVRHKLLEIKVVIKKTLVFAGLFASVYMAFVFFALLSQMFFERFVTQNRWISMIPSVLVVTIMLRPLENFLIAITDKYLFQKKYDYKELLKIFTSEVLTVLELDRLIQLTEDKLTYIMKLKFCKFVEIASLATFGDEARNDESMLKLPISMKGEVLGTLVLGEKKSDEDYTQEDIDILQSLTKTLGIAISNAKLFNELSKARAQVAQKDKMATIGTLAAGMAHEIRNPLTTIRNFADYLPERYDDKNFMDKFDKLIPREIDRIESIARSLLEFSSTEDTVKDEEFSIEEPVKTVISLLEPQYRTSETKVVCDFSKRHIVKGSKIQLQDIIFNIMNYIMAEAPKGSSIIIECSEGDKELKLYIRSKDLVVANHIIKDVFEPVSGLYKERRGFGFNLFIAKELIERSGATLKISSDSTIGSEFRIEFKKSVFEQP